MARIAFGPHGYQGLRNLELALFLLTHPIRETGERFGLTTSRVVQCFKQACRHANQEAFRADRFSEWARSTLEPFRKRQAFWQRVLTQALREARPPRSGPRRRTRSQEIPEPTLRSGRPAPGPHSGKIQSKRRQAARRNATRHEQESAPPRCTPSV